MKMSNLLKIVLGLFALAFVAIVVDQVCLNPTEEVDVTTGHKVWYASEHGLVGDGKTNDREALSALLDSASHGGIIMFDSGKYYLLDGGTITLNDDAYIFTVVGDSVTTSFSNNTFSVSPEEDREYTRISQIIRNVKNVGSGCNFKYTIETDVIIYRDYGSFEAAMRFPYENKATATDENFDKIKILEWKKAICVQEKLDKSLRWKN